jgi:hypothetical protein
MEKERSSYDFSYLDYPLPSNWRNWSGHSHTKVHTVMKRIVLRESVSNEAQKRAY